MSWHTSSMLAITAGSSVISAAASISGICSARVAPTMVEATKSCCLLQAKLSAVTVVPMSSAISAKRRHLPTSARLGLSRVNQAIFALRAEAVTDIVVPLAERVSKDPSGRTRFDKRIAGRTVRIARDPRRGQLVYSVHP